MPLLNEIVKTEELMALYHASELPGEEYHPDYLTNPSIFRKLSKSDVQTEKQLKVFFDKQAKRVVRETDWDEYKNMKASVSDMISTKWSAESLKMTVLLTKTLIDAVQAGGEFTEEEIGIDVGWSSDDTPANEFMTNYTPKLAGGLTDTTIGRVKSAIKLSLQLGEGQKEAKRRVYQTIADKRRAAAIAHTESVRSFTGGRLMVGYSIGADRKEWDTTSNPCPICEPLNGKIVKLSEAFTAGIFATPGHPNCRCLNRLLMPENGKPKKWDVDIAEEVVKQLSY